MKKKVYKFFVAGPPNAGKTTFVQTVSEIIPLDTDVKSKDRKTTVAFDFGVITIDSEREIHIYGLPGQDRFSFIWEIVRNGALGFIYLIPATGYDILDIMTHYRTLIKIANLPHVIAVTKVDLKPLETGDIFQIANTLGMDDREIFTLDPRNKMDVKSTIERLIEKILFLLR
ncbi:MAG: ATP/GTP-binding protein [Actinobacteria bacterium]|nr:ATP/GTP-binding protein [Actinomycetota bacterium]